MPEQSAFQNGGADITGNASEESSNSRGFALNVDLSACVGLPAYFRVWVRRNTHNHARSMRWLGEHVRRAANIRGPFLMLVDKYLLPPNETLSLLRSSDSVRLARVENEWQRPFSYNNETDYDPPSPPDEPVVNNTRKPLEPQPSPQQHSSLPHTLSDSAIKQSTFKTSSVSTPDSQPSLVDENLQRVKRRALALLQQVTGEEQEQKGQDDVDAPKKRRRRVRRRRPARPISPFVEPTEPMSVSIESPASKSNVKASSLPDVRSTPDASLVLLTSEIESRPYPTPDSVVAPSSTPNTSPRVTSLALGTPRVCQTLEPLASPSLASQTSRAARSSTSMVLIAAEPAPAPVLRNHEPARAPRLVRALSAGPKVSDDGITMTTNASFWSAE